LPAELRDLVAAELNVASLSPLGAQAGAGELVDYVVKPNFRALGRRFGSATPAVAAAITAMPAADLATAVLAGGTVPVPVPAVSPGAEVAGSGAAVAGSGAAVGASEVLVGADDVIVTRTPRAGWAVATDAGETVAIDTTITPELRREGLAREVIRLIQEARKNDGLEVSDRIALGWSASDPELARALTERAAMIADEVLAVEFGPWPPTGRGALCDAREHGDEDLGLRFWIARA